MRKLLSAAALAAFVLAVAHPASADAGILARFKTDLTGAAEVPGPGDPDGFGVGAVKPIPRRGEVCFRIEVKDIGVPTLAHIHQGAPDVAGPIVVTLIPPPEDGIIGTCITGVDEALARDIGHNPSGYYVNVHTADFPSGAVRGQLPASLNCDLLTA